MPTISRLDSPTPADLAAILAPLDASSVALGLAWRPTPLVVALLDDAGEVVGGAIGEAAWGWLHVSILAVPDSLRGLGWGTRLMASIESLALSLGCHHSWLDTFSFQARPFYERLGYSAFGVLPDYPPGHHRIFLSKPLTRPDAPSPELPLDPAGG